MVFQSQALFPHVTVAENIGFGLFVRDVRKPEIARRAHDAAQLVGCDDLTGRRPHELSGGQRQRVALARVVAREPRVLLLDEPLSNLDVHVRTEIRAELRRVHERLGRTTLHVTHDQAEALALGDRVAVLRDGRFAGARVERPTVLIPTVMPEVAYGLLWLWLLNPIYGPINALLTVGGENGANVLGRLPPQWLTDPNHARAGIILMSLFVVGEAYVILLVARFTIPAPYELARSRTRRPGTSSAASRSRSSRRS
jgi:energy-coupling factor transporter ATP-binding protein EcfA2